MAYYDDAFYALNANIASNNSMLVDLKYRYNRLLSKILTLGPENVSDELVNEQIGLVNSIKEKKLTISMLEAELVNFTPMQPPEVILQQILEQQQVPPAPAPQEVTEQVTEQVAHQVSEEVPTTTD